MLLCRYCRLVGQALLLGLAALLVSCAEAPTPRQAWQEDSSTFCASADECRAVGTAAANEEAVADVEDLVGTVCDTLEYARQVFVASNQSVSMAQINAQNRKRVCSNMHVVVEKPEVASVVPRGKWLYEIVKVQVLVSFDGAKPRAQIGVPPKYMIRKARGLWT